MKKEIIIIGAGPAGIAAAVQLKRFGFSPFVIDREGEGGGLVKNAYLIENYPGFPKGISGIKFAKLLKVQLKRFKIQVHKGNVKEIDYSNNIFQIKTEKYIFYSNILIVASGSIPKKLNVKGYDKIPMDKIFYEIFPLRQVNKKRIVIIGGGDIAFDYALTLAKNNEVKIIFRKERPSCIPALEKLVRKNKICCYNNTKLIELKRNLNEILIECISKSKRVCFHTDYFVIAIGREPNMEFLPKKLRKEIPNKLYFIGDVAHCDKRQVAIAVADGISTAMNIYKNKFKLQWK
jgi:thioredoxin reductase